MLLQRDYGPLLCVLLAVCAATLLQLTECTQPRTRPPLGQILSSIVSDVDKRTPPGAVVVTVTDTAKPFPMVTCKRCDCGLCEFISREEPGCGVWSPLTTKIFEYLLGNGACIAASQGNKQAVVVDVGANVGYFTVLSASYGCKVLAFEPVLGARRFAAANVLLSGFQHLAHVYPYAIAAQEGKVVVPAGMWDNVRVGDNVVGAGADAAAGNGVQMMPLHRVVNESVLLLKIDTEGFEESVFAGAQTLLQQHTVHNIIIEVKDYNSQHKRDLLHSMKQLGRFKLVYNFCDDYLSCYNNASTAIVDITNVVENKHVHVTFQCEDFWLTNQRPSGFPLSTLEAT